MRIVTPGSAQPGRRPRRWTIAAAAITLMVAACGQQAASDTAASDPAADSTADDAKKADKSAEDLAPDADADISGRCAAGVTGDQLDEPAELGSADIDGDGAADLVSLGQVPDRGDTCTVAVLVTTGGETFAAPLAGGGQAVVDSPLGDPVFAEVDGSPGAEIVITTSFNPRGGGQLGMFSWVNGGLVQVEQGGKPWSLFVTIDDGGGTPRLLTCSAGGFTAVTAYPPGLDTGSSVTTYTLRAGVVRHQQRLADVSATWKQVRAAHPGLPRAGLAIFPDCG
ncbi:MAG: hypothetical protein M3529_01950 [Actinomycetota bacterium]|nr:hypothetical protein [Actinomycetota bacterium]